MKRSCCFNHRFNGR